MNFVWKLKCGIFFLLEDDVDVSFNHGFHDFFAIGRQTWNNAICQCWRHVGDRLALVLREYYLIFSEGMQCVVVKTQL